jgi:chorismate synthase
MAHTTYSLTQLYAVVEGKIPENDAISRQILDALLTLKACLPLIVTSKKEQKEVKILSGAHECPAQHQNRGDNYD